MGMTLGEKIIARAAGVDFVKPNDIHTVTLDRMMSNDGTTHLTVDMYHNKLKNPKIADKDKVVFIMDHNVPAENPKTAEAHKKMRDFAIENDIKLYEGQGVCHQIMMEDYVCPGELIFGADSHTTSYGALGAFGTGVGCTDFLYAMTTGTSWVMVPETIRFNLHGKLREGVYPRDLILTIIGDIGANGANYKIMEFAGDGAHNLSVDDRMVLCNLTVEAGVKAGYCRSAPPLNASPSIPVTIGLPCSSENEEVPHGEKNQGQGLLRPRSVNGLRRTRSPVHRSF